MLKTILIQIVDTLGYFCIICGLVLTAFGILSLFHQGVKAAAILLLSGVGSLLAGLIIKWLAGKKTGMSFWEYLIDDLILGIFSR